VLVTQRLYINEGQQAEWIISHAAAQPAHSRPVQLSHGAQ
jgi:hypothetical protein